MEKIDLHIHTNLSDGLLAPEEVVLQSLKKGCKKIAITDHEIVKNYNNLSQKYGINIIPGIEFNTSFRNLHILGYNITNIDKMNHEMKDLRIANETICYQVIDKLKKDDFDISVDKVIKYLNNIKMDFEVIDKRKIVKYLIYKGYAANVMESYSKLIGFNQKYYVPNKKISPEEIIELVKECGGISVLAHPNILNLYNADLENLIKKLKYQGLEGIETINKKMKLDSSFDYSNIAKKMELIQTIGSDFHDLEFDEIGLDDKDNICKDFKMKILINSKKY